MHLSTGQSQVSSFFFIYVIAETYSKSCMLLRGLYVFAAGELQKGSGTKSDQTVSAMKHDADIIEELMRQHHTMASIMQSRLTNMQVQP
jgi:hypothetical protein